MSREYRGKRIVIWPVYIDANATRSDGRKIPLRYAVRRPRIEEIVEAARRLNLNPEVDESRYPRSWIEYNKRVIVDKRKPKLRILADISREIQIIRSEKKRHRT